MRPDNIKECIYSGYRLSDVYTGIEVSDNIQRISIGSENDYEPKPAGRVKIEIETQDEILHLDLEDVLRFAKVYCTRLYQRVGLETHQNFIEV